MKDEMKGFYLYELNSDIAKEFNPPSGVEIFELVRVQGDRTYLCSAEPTRWVEVVGVVITAQDPSVYQYHTLGDIVFYLHGSTQPTYVSEWELKKSTKLAARNIRDARREVNAYWVRGAMYSHDRGFAPHSKPPAIMRAHPHMFKATMSHDTLRMLKMGSDAYIRENRKKREAKDG